MWRQLLDQIITGDVRALARGISFVENESNGFEDLLAALPRYPAAIVGITGPPGAGKSTLVDALIGAALEEEKRVAVLCVDPSSPFHLGAVLGDRIRMSQWFTDPRVFIRSLATRGSMGGLHPKIIEITELIRSAQFDYIIIETVGVGQSEIEIAGLADATVVVLVPEAGDEVQTMKAGLMEIADIFVVNKSDRPGADGFVKHLRQMLSPSFTTHKEEVPVIKTIASQKQGTDELFREIKQLLERGHHSDKRCWLLAERAWKIIQENRMKDLDKQELARKINEIDPALFNLYRFARQYY